MVVRRCRLSAKRFLKEKERRSRRKSHEDCGGVRGGKQPLEFWDGEDAWEVAAEGKVDLPACRRWKMEEKKTVGGVNGRRRPPDDEGLIRPTTISSLFRGGS